MLLALSFAGCEMSTQSRTNCSDAKYEDLCGVASALDPASMEGQGMGRTMIGGIKCSSGGSRPPAPPTSLADDDFPAGDDRRKACELL